MFQPTNSISTSWQISLWAMISETDLRTAIKYLEDAAKLYDALAALPMQKASCRSHMIKQLTQKLKSKLNDKTRPH